MPKLTLILDSHQLTEAQNCFRADKYSRIDNWEPKQSKPALSKGGFFHDALKVYYTMKRDGVAFPEIQSALLQFYNENIVKLTTECGVDTADALLIQRRLLEYAQHDWNTRQSWKILAIESGFSVKLYEDSFCLYIYEGRIDLIVEITAKRCVIDHKTQSMRYDWPLYSNQMMGYCFASQSKYALYNYIGLQQDVGNNTFRAEMESFYDDQIEMWRREAIETYNQILFNTLFNKFPRNRAGCINRFGLCNYYEVCQKTTEKGELSVLNSNFKKREKPWRAWE